MVILVTAFLLMLAKLQLKSALFVSKYFYTLLIFVNAFGWFLIIAFLVFIIVTKRRWPVTKETVMEKTQGQDYAILYIKKAKEFVRPPSSQSNPLLYRN